MLGQAHFFKEVSPLEAWLSPTARKDSSYKMPHPPLLHVFHKKSRSCLSSDHLKPPFCLWQTNFHLGPWPLNVTKCFLCFVFISSPLQEDAPFVLQLLNGQSSRGLNHCIRGKCSRYSERWILNQTVYVEETSDWNFLLLLLFWHNIDIAILLGTILSVSVCILNSSWAVVEQAHKMNNTSNNN